MQLSKNLETLIKFEFSFNFDFQYILSIFKVSFPFSPDQQILHHCLKKVINFSVEQLSSLITISCKIMESIISSKMEDYKIF